MAKMNIKLYCNCKLFNLVENLTEQFNRRTPKHFPLIGINCLGKIIIRWKTRYFYVFNKNNFNKNDYFKDLSPFSDEYQIIISISYIIYYIHYIFNVY